MKKLCQNCQSIYFAGKRNRVCPFCLSAANCGAQRRRKDRERYAEGSHTLEEWQEQVRYQNARCFWCNKDLYDDNGRFRGTKDHLTPLSRGGNDSIENLVAACLPCNSRKRDRTEAEYRAFLISKVSTVPASTKASPPEANPQFALWPAPAKGIAKVIAKLAVSKQMEESTLPFRGMDVTAATVRKHVLREQVQQILRRRA